jgi:hypothetical protein
MDRNYKRFVMFENTRYLADPGARGTPNTTGYSVVALTAIKISFRRS